jgi:hypothetical protein
MAFLSFYKAFNDPIIPQTTKNLRGRYHFYSVCGGGWKRCRAPSGVRVQHSQDIFDHEVQATI